MHFLIQGPSVWMLFAVKRYHMKSQCDISLSIPWTILHFKHLFSFPITQSFAASPVCFELVAFHTGTVVWAVCIVAVLAAGSINIALVEICKMETGIYRATLIVVCVVQRIILISQSPKLRYFGATSKYNCAKAEFFSAKMCIFQDKETPIRILYKYKYWLLAPWIM